MSKWNERSVSAAEPDLNFKDPEHFAEARSIIRNHLLDPVPAPAPGHRRGIIQICRQERKIM